MGQLADPPGNWHRLAAWRESYWGNDLARHQEDDEVRDWPSGTSRSSWGDPATEGPEYSIDACGTDVPGIVKASTAGDLRHDFSGDPILGTYTLVALVRIDNRATTGDYAYVLNGASSDAPRIFKRGGTGRWAFAAPGLGALYYNPSPAVSDELELLVAVVRDGAGATHDWRVGDELVTTTGTANDFDGALRLFRNGTGHNEADNGIHAFGIYPGDLTADADAWARVRQYAHDLGADNVADPGVALDRDGLPCGRTAWGDVEVAVELLDYTTDVGWFPITDRVAVAGWSEGATQGGAGPLSRTSRATASVEVLDQARELDTSNPAAAGLSWARVGNHLRIRARSTHAGASPDWAVTFQGPTHTHKWTDNVATLEARDPWAQLMVANLVALEVELNPSEVVTRPELPATDYLEEVIDSARNSLTAYLWAVWPFDTDIVAGASVVNLARVVLTKGESYADAADRVLEADQGLAWFANALHQARPTYSYRDGATVWDDALDETVPGLDITSLNCAAMSVTGVTGSTLDQRVNYVAVEGNERGSSSSDPVATNTVVDYDDDVLERDGVWPRTWEGLDLWAQAVDDADPGAATFAARILRYFETPRPSTPTEVKLYPWADGSLWEDVLALRPAAWVRWDGAPNLVDTTVRVVGLEHALTADGWSVTLLTSELVEAAGTPGDVLFLDDAETPAAATLLEGNSPRPTYQPGHNWRVERASFPFATYDGAGLVDMAANAFYSIQTREPNHAVRVIPAASSTTIAQPRPVALCIDEDNHWTVIANTVSGDLELWRYWAGAATKVKAQAVTMATTGQHALMLEVDGDELTAYIYDDGDETTELASFSHTMSATDVTRYANVTRVGVAASIVAGAWEEARAHVSGALPA